MKRNKKISLIASNRICPNEFIAFARKIDGIIHVRYRCDYGTLFVDAKYWLQYCNEKASLNDIAIIDVGVPIVLIPESPHVDEFFEDALLCYKGGVTYSRPINGKNNGSAGHLTQKWLPMVLDNVGAIEDDMWHPVIIANACPYQCSEGLPTKSGPRDENFLSLFLGSRASLNFSHLVNCIKQYTFCKVVVACTKGNTQFIKGWLKSNCGLVDDAIREKSLRCCVEYALLRSGIPFVSVCHPCSWFDSRCRQLRPKNTFSQAL